MASLYTNSQVIEGRRAGLLEEDAKNTLWQQQAARQAAQDANASTREMNRSALQTADAYQRLANDPRLGAFAVQEDFTPPAEGPPAGTTGVVGTPLNTPAPDTGLTEEQRRTLAASGAGSRPILSMDLSREQLAAYNHYLSVTRVNGPRSRSRNNNGAARREALDRLRRLGLDIIPARPGQQEDTLVATRGPILEQPAPTGVSAYVRAADRGPIWEPVTTPPSVVPLTEIPESFDISASGSNTLGATPDAATKPAPAAPTTAPTALPRASAVRSAVEAAIPGLRVTDTERTQTQNANTRGSAPNSEHLHGTAIDFNIGPPGQPRSTMTPAERSAIAAAIGVPETQLRMEFTTRGTAPHWHASWGGQDGNGGGGTPQAQVLQTAATLSQTHTPENMQRLAYEEDVAMTTLQGSLRDVGVALRTGAPNAREMLAAIPGLLVAQRAWTHNRAVALFQTQNNSDGLAAIFADAAGTSADNIRVTPDGDGYAIFANDGSGNFVRATSRMTAAETVQLARSTVNPAVAAAERAAQLELMAVQLEQEGAFRRVQEQNRSDEMQLVYEQGMETLRNTTDRQVQWAIANNQVVFGQDRNGNPVFLMRDQNGQPLLRAADITTTPGARSPGLFGRRGPDTTDVTMLGGDSDVLGALAERRAATGQ